MNYVRLKWKQGFPCLAVLILFNAYFFFFIQNGQIEYLAYLDVLFIVPFALATGAGCWKSVKQEKEKKHLMEQGELLCRTLPFFENQDIAEHDVRVVEEQMNRQFKENCDLQDFVAKWCHEFKIPLSAGLMMNDKIQDAKLRMDMREQLERMSQQINSMLLGCRLQSSIFDIQIKRTHLAECVKASLKNNRFFLIQRGFEVRTEIDDAAVYTDSSWIVYVLDQLIGNAVKYGRKGVPDSGEDMPPALSIWTEKREGQIRLFVEDQGEGIMKRDIRRIFEKGYTGSNYHNGRYKSTGMGLYMVSKILDRLGHGIYAESEYGIYTRFCIVFQENGYYMRGGEQ